MWTYKFSAYSWQSISALILQNIIYFKHGHAYLRQISKMRFPIWFCTWFTVSFSCLAMAWPLRDSTLKLLVRAGKIRKATTVISLPQDWKTERERCNLNVTGLGNKEGTVYFTAAGLENRKRKVWFECCRTGKQSGNSLFHYCRTRKQEERRCDLNVAGLGNKKGTVYFTVAGLPGNRKTKLLSIFFFFIKLHLIGKQNTEGFIIWLQDWTLKRKSKNTIIWLGNR